MNITEGYLLRIYVGESDKKDGMPLYEWLIKHAKEHSLSGATAIRGIESFGKTNQLHTAKILQLSTDLPIIVELVDSISKIESFMRVLETVNNGGLVTLQKIEIRTF